MQFILMITVWALAHIEQKVTESQLQPKSPWNLFMDYSPQRIISSILWDSTKEILLLCGSIRLYDCIAPFTPYAFGLYYIICISIYTIVLWFIATLLVLTVMAFLCALHMVYLNVNLEFFQANLHLQIYGIYKYRYTHECIHIHI